MKKPFWGGTSRFLFWTLGLLAVSLTIFLAACTPTAKATEPVQGEGPRDKCGFIEPSDVEVQKILSFGKSLFASADWVKTYTVEPYRITIARHNDTEGAVAQIDYNIYTCGYTQADMNDYFSEQNINQMFADYESHTLAHFCEKESLALYQYNLVFGGEEFSANLWVKQESDTRLWTMRLIFPQASADRLNEYSQKLFPELTTCP